MRFVASTISGESASAPSVGSNMRSSSIRMRGSGNTFASCLLMRMGTAYRKEARRLEAKVDAGGCLKAWRRWLRWCRHGHRDAKQANGAHLDERRSYEDFPGDAVSSGARLCITALHHGFTTRLSCTTTTTRVFRT